MWGITLRVYRQLKSKIWPEFALRLRENKETKKLKQVLKVHDLKENFGDDLSPAPVFPPMRKHTVSKLYPGSANRDEVALSLL